jgi:hypothetical protein
MLSTDFTPFGGKPNVNFLQKEVLQPEITVMGNCRACGELVQVNTPKCPYCDTLLNQQSLMDSAKINFVVTQAISSANTIRTFRPAAYLLILLSLGRFVLEHSFRNLLFVVVWLFPLFTVLRWFMKHGGLNSSDTEYLEAKKQMKSALILWLAATLINWVTFAVAIGSGK